MTETECRTIVERAIEPMMRQLGIWHWKVRVAYESPGEVDWIASCTSRPDYNKAFIQIDARLLDDEDEVLKTLRHELLHIVLAPMDAYRLMQVQHDPESDEGKRELAAWQYFLEQQVINLERACDGMAGKLEWSQDAPSPSAAKQPARRVRRRAG